MAKIDKRTIEQGRTAGRFKAVAPDDNNNLPEGTPFALYVGTAGDLTVWDMDGDAVVIKNAAVGYHPIRPTRILATGTTASNIVALY